MFWTDVEERVIVRSHLDGSNATLLVGSDLSFPGIAIHHTSLNIHCQQRVCTHMCSIIDCSFKYS